MFIKKRFHYKPENEKEKELLTILILAKQKIKKIYKNSSEPNSAIMTFYAQIKMTNQLFFFLTNKDQDTSFVKYQTQKIIYYLIKILLKEKYNEENNLFLGGISLTVYIFFLIIF